MLKKPASVIERLRLRLRLRLKQVESSLNLDLDLSLPHSLWPCLTGFLRRSAEDVFSRAKIAFPYPARSVLANLLSPTNPPEYAGGNLQILSSIDHNGQRLTVQGFSPHYS